MTHERRRRPLALGIPSQQSQHSLICSDGPLPTQEPHDFSRYPAYEYSQIASNQVRLLTLCGGWPQEPIYCHLQALKFSELQDARNSYDALSYSWGKEDAIYPILISNNPAQSHQGYTKFHIRPNLYRALRRVREAPGRNIKLWIDAICINQTNSSEKTHQFPHMIKIYHFASNACIWLGESETGGPETERGITFVEDIVTLKFLGELIEDPDRTPDWLAFAELLTKDWFSRRWIIQEVAACRYATIRYGGTEIKHRDFVDAVEIFYRSFDQIWKSCESRESRLALEEWRRKSLSTKALIETTINVFRHWEGYRLQSRWSLERLVMKLHPFRVTDPRDTIYAVLGISSDNAHGNATNLSADERILGGGDYRKQPMEVYIDFVRYAVFKSKSLDIICRKWATPISTNWSSYLESGHVPGAEVELPSWIGVVDRDPALTQIEKPFIGEPGRCPYKACLDTLAECSFGIANQVYDGTITVKGRKLGVINLASDTISILDDVLQTLDKLEFPVGKTSTIPGSLWRTLVGDRDSDGGNPPRWYQRACRYWLTKEQGEVELVTAFQKRVMEVVLNRKIFACEAPDQVDQMGGIGPSAILAGDVICILFGCSVPVILRECHEGENTYTLIGECYVRGKMEGEHFFGLEQRSVDMQSSTFKIR